MWLRRGAAWPRFIRLRLLLGQLVVALVLGAIAGGLIGRFGIPYLHWLGFVPVFLVDTLDIPPTGQSLFRLLPDHDMLDLPS